ncbi:antibiotic biosynthesis monooxygenase [Peribacillus cavernae]|uniref:Antibiotic biosynthesis monooxygenase n=1 Tax=Peribacillus cavernae TaxID=1674310 RepID=A0A433HIL8_9BACI|nr:antibiotic biosynthesis monooxygenase [Peribacillus cavernae]MDQ0217788.1 heme-degrading monooxygenase HmoA [Peribacillus cavernae]RUQ28241.1 antibiotic biosynthesis monooxygenase [Peribacillus cavernae]
MFVMNASFEIEKEYEEILLEKGKKDKKELEAAKGIISVERWQKEHSETVEYVTVSKWESQADFKAWIARDEHVEEHKEMNIKRKESVQTPYKIKKTLRSFEVVEE